MADRCPFCQRFASNAFTWAPGGLGVIQLEPPNPVTPGHQLFAPAVHREHGQWKADRDTATAVQAAMQWAAAQRCDFNLITAGGPTQATAEHIHVHYLPRRPGDGLHLPWTGQPA